MLVSFGDLGGFLVWGNLAVEGGSMTLAKEAIFQSVALGFDVPNRPGAVWRFSKKLNRAANEILFPAASSIKGITTTARIRILSR